MGAVKEWLTAIVVVSLLLSVLQQLMGEGTVRKVGSFIGGLVLLVTMLRPLPGLELELTFSDWEQEISAAEEALQAANQEELAGLIESRTAAYISEQAEKLGAQVEAAVKVEAGPEGIPVPAEVRLTGVRSAELERWIERELGIPAERQVWNDES